MRFAGEHIWIIGASSGIGRALAIALEAQGASLILSARRTEALEALNQTLGGVHDVLPLDVANATDIAKAAAHISANLPKLDRVIFLAALYKPGNIADIEPEFAHKMVEVNLCGAMTLAHAVLPIFDAQQSGQIVLCGSVAGYLGLPNGQPYSATKAAIINFAESLYAEAPDYLDVKLISPGFVRTPMTDKNSFDMPMRIEPEDAAKAIANGLQQRAFEIHFPKRFTRWVKILRLLPYALSLRITRRMQHKMKQDAEA